jgi:hypothetical protein
MSKKVGASTSRNPQGFHGLYRDNFAFTPIFWNMANCILESVPGEPVMYVSLTGSSRLQTLKFHKIKWRGPFSGLREFVVWKIAITVLEEPAVSVLVPTYRLQNTITQKTTT